MKRLLLILILTLSFQSWTKADDINDFEIEGMSIGDSLLDYMTMNEYLTNKKNEYNYENIFATIGFSKDSFKKYDRVQIHYKLNDQNKNIYGITGVIYFDNKITECLNQKKFIKSDITSSLKKFEVFNDTFNHWADKENNSIVYQTILEFDQGSGISISCFDWSKKKTEEKGWYDNLKVSLDTKEFKNFVRSLSN